MDAVKPKSSRLERLKASTKEIYLENLLKGSIRESKGCLISTSMGFSMGTLTQSKRFAQCAQG